MKIIAATALALCLMIAGCSAVPIYAPAPATEPPITAPMPTTPAPAPTPEPDLTPIPTPTPFMHDRAVNCLFIGDSIIGAGAITQTLLDMQESDNPGITLLGTRGEGMNRHEGRGRWRTRDYVSAKEYKDYTNAFYNPAIKKFDFSYYMEQQGYGGVDYVFINLGINDTILCRSDKSINAEIPDILSRLDKMITSIHKYSTDIKIGIFITTPPTSNVERFNEIYKGVLTHARYSRTNKLWIDALFKKYSGHEANNIYLVPVNLYIDPAEIKDVHPTPEGYRQMAAAVWTWLKVH